MKIGNRSKGGVVATISRLGRNRRVVIPKQICEHLGIHEGDFIEVSARDNVAIVKPGKSLKNDDVLTPKEAEKVRQGEAQLRRGLYVTLEQLEHSVDRKARQRSRKAVL
jgi:AbrB family looped-hinge helix DNA binding protein